MTKFLSECLEAPEPFFRQGVQRLEMASGQLSHDIRLSLDVQKAAKLKTHQLGADPHDTTPAELYYLLQEKIKALDAKLVRTLQTQAARHVSAEANLTDGMVHALKNNHDSKRSYALKQSSFKNLIKKQPPKKAMRKLGYRSLDSFLKHESAASILTATKLFETEQWQARFYENYAKLRSSDFEDRTIDVVKLNTGKWQTLAHDYVEETRHNILSFKELGALVILLLPANAPAGTTTASLSIALDELNKLRASGSYLKLCQVRPDFGKIVQSVALAQPELNFEKFDTAMPWHLVQRYYARFKNFNDNLADPHMQLQDLSWHPIEYSLAAIEPAFRFWQDTAHLAVLHNRKPVSFNIIDTALSACNNLHFEERVSQYFQDSLWHELMLRYLQRDLIDESIMNQLRPQLAEERVLA